MRSLAYQVGVIDTTNCPACTLVWKGAARRFRLPADWPAPREAARQRAGDRCEASMRRGTRCHPERTGIGAECDHSTPGDDRGPENLCWLPPPCHEVKTARETRKPPANLKARDDNRHDDPDSSNDCRRNGRPGSCPTSTLRTLGGFQGFLAYF